MKTLTEICNTSNDSFKDYLDKKDKFLEENELNAERRILNKNIDEKEINISSINYF